MVQFCYSRLYFGTKTVSCHLLQGMARMNVAERFNCILYIADTSFNLKKKTASLACPLGSGGPCSLFRSEARRRKKERLIADYSNKNTCMYAHYHLKNVPSQYFTSSSLFKCSQLFYLNSLLCFIAFVFFIFFLFQ